MFEGMIVEFSETNICGNKSVAKMCKSTQEVYL
jgi:hypothetical protein